MRPGIGKGVVWTLLALCALAAVGASALAAAAPAQPEGAVSSSLERVQPSGRGAAAGATTIFTLDGTSTANSLSAFADSTGRLVITSPDGITAPGDDAPAGTEPDCVQDSPTQVSCRPGLIGAIAGDLKAGADTFTAQATLTTTIGISLVNEERALSGGPGRDRISGGLGGDLINGGAGNDALLGFGGGDLLRGQRGRDSLRGGGSADVLMGGSGPDRLHGGAARDLCNGGGGVDIAQSCNVARKIP